MGGIKEGFVLAQFSDDTYTHLKQFVNIKTGDVFLYVHRKMFVANGTSFANIGSYFPTSPASIKTLVQSEDGTFQNGEITISTSGKIIINAMDVNTSIRGGAWIMYKYNN